MCGYIYIYTHKYIACYIIALNFSLLQNERENEAIRRKKECICKGEIIKCKREKMKKID